MLWKPIAAISFPRYRKRTKSARKQKGEKRENEYNISRKRAIFELNYSCEKTSSFYHRFVFASLRFLALFRYAETRKRDGSNGTGNHLIHDRRYRHASRRPRAISNRR